MDYHQRNIDDDYSILTYSQPLDSLSITSILNSSSKTNSIIVPKQSNINIDRSIIRTRLLRKRYYQQHISSHSNTSLSTAIITEKHERSLKKSSKIPKQEARPLGTCVRKCDQCRQLKHILLVECTLCFRMMDIDLKDCKCQIFQNQNILENITCSICDCELTLDGYIICANRTCQTILSASINKENIDEYQEKSILSTNLTNISYPKLAYRTVAVQINTLDNLPSLQRFLPTIINEENEESSLLSWSKHDLNWTINSLSSSSSNTSHLNSDSGVDETVNIARNMIVGFNSNQPTKLALQSEDELPQPSNSANVDNSTEHSEMPKSPRCLAIMNVSKRHDRLSTLLMLQTNKTCQTDLSCLTDINKRIKSEELLDVIIAQTKNPTKIERQIQVDTIKNYFNIRAETTDHVEKVIIDEDRVLQALTDRDGQRWPEFIDQLITEQSQFSPSEIAQQLLDTIEHLHSAQRLNNLTTGQLQRKVRYAMSKFKHIDEHSYLKTNRSRRTSECNGRLDMSVTVTQIDNRPNRQSSVSSDQNWKPYVDRLFKQGHSAEEIQRLLREAAENTMQSDDQRLQNVFNYINTKSKEQKEKITPSGIAFVANTTKTKSIARPSFSISSERKIVSKEVLPTFSNRDHSVKTKVTKNKTDNSLIKSSEKTTIIDLNKHEKEQNLPTPDNDDIVVTLQQNTSQIQSVVESKTSPTNELNLEEQTINALHHVQNTIAAINNTDSHLHPHSSNIQIVLNRLITNLESDKMNSDNIESLMTQCIELLNNEKKIIVPQLEKIHSEDLKKEISNTINLLQEYKKTVIPSTINNEDSSYHQHISDLVMISSDAQVPFKQNTSHTTPDVQQQDIVSEYQETAGLIRCRPIPYTSSNEKRSTETLQQVLISSTEHIPSNTTEELTEQLMSKKSNLNHASDVPLKDGNKLHNNQSQIKWLNSLLSKLSDNVNSTTSISSASPSLPVPDQTNSNRNKKEEDEQQEKQRPSSNEPSKSSLPVHQLPTDMHEMIDVTDVVMLQEEHIMPIVVPTQGSIKSHEQFQVTKIKLLNKKTTSSSKQVRKSKDQLESLQIDENNKNNTKEPSHSNLDSDHTFQKTPSVTTLNIDNIYEKEQSTSSIGGNESQSKNSRSSSSSDIDLSYQLDHHEGHEDITSPKQSTSDKEISSSSLDENENPMNSLHINSQSSSIDASTATSKIFNNKNDMNKLQLPISIQQFNISNTIQLNSIVTHLHNQNDTDSSKQSSINSEDQDDIGTPIENNEEMMNEFYTPTMLSPEHETIQESPNTILSPTRMAKIESAKYKKLVMPLSSSFMTNSPSTAKSSKEDELQVEHDNTSQLLVEEPSKPTIPDNNNDEIVKKSKSKSRSSVTDDTPMKLKPQDEKNVHSIYEETQSSSSSLSMIQDEDNPAKKTSHNSSIKEKSASNENIINDEIPENTSTSELLNNKNDESEDSSSIYSSIPPEQSRQNKNDTPEKKNSLNSESYNNTKDFPIETSNAEQQSPSSPVIGKKRPMTPTTTAVSPSSIININSKQQDLKSELFSSETKHDKLISDDNQGAVSVSSFNLAHLNDIPSDIGVETEDERLLSKLGKQLSNDKPHSVNPKQDSNSLIHNNIPSSSIPKLLSKRSSIKQTSTTVQSIKPNIISSITDISTSSNNTITTDHFPSTHSTISGQEEIISLKKINKSKNDFLANSYSNFKSNTLKKSSQNQRFTSPNKKEKSLDRITKKSTNNSLLTNSETIPDTERTADTWKKSHEDLSQFLIINEPNENKTQQKKNNKDRIMDGSGLLPFNLKARGDHQAYTIDSSRLPSIEQSSGEYHIKKLSNDPSRRPVIRLPVTQIEKFPCGTIGPRPHPSSIAHQLFYLPSIHNHHQNFSPHINQPIESLTDRLYSLMSPETDDDDDKQAFESILNGQQQYQISKIEQTKFQYMYLLDTSTGHSVRGKQYPILTDEIDMIDDPYACTIVNKWAFADLVKLERDKFHQNSTDNINKSKLNKNIKICLLKRPLTEFEENIFKEVDIISIPDSQTILLHIPSITLDNQVFIKNRKFKCDQTFNEHSEINTIYHSTISPLIDKSINGNKCLCLIGGGKYSGKTYLLRSLIDFLSFDLTNLISTYNIHIKLLGICHNRIVDLLQNYSPIRLIKSLNSSLIPNDEFHLKTNHDINYIISQIKKRRRYLHQLIQINFLNKDQSIIIGSLMIVVLASSQYIYTRNLCSHRKKFLINSLNRTILAFKRALLGTRQNPDRIRTGKIKDIDIVAEKFFPIAFNNDILTRLIQPYIFDNRSNICYIGTLNPGHRHRTATKSTLEFARNLRFCLKRINKQRRKREKFSQI